MFSILNLKNLFLLFKAHEQYVQYYLQSASVSVREMFIGKHYKDWI